MPIRTIGNYCLPEQEQLAEQELLQQWTGTILILEMPQSQWKVQTLAEAVPYPKLSQLQFIRIRLCWWILRKKPYAPEQQVQ